jgi:hypothetical protein
MQVISVRDVVADARNHFGDRRAPIEGYRGVSLLHDSDSAKSSSAKSAVNGSHSNGNGISDGHYDDHNEDVASAIDNDGL